MKKYSAAIAAAVALTAVPLGTLPGRAQQPDNYDRGRIYVPESASGFSIDVLVDGCPLPKISSHGRIYVEAPWDKDFELKISVPPNDRFLAVCSVDGLSVLNGKPASAEGPGYLIDNGSLTIPGFRLDTQNVARFHFGSRTDSYASAMGKPTNVGVIGTTIFTERRSKPSPPPPPSAYYYHHHPSAYTGGKFPHQVPPVYMGSHVRTPADNINLTKVADEDGDFLLEWGGTNQDRERASRLRRQEVSKRTTNRPAESVQLDHDMGTEFGHKSSFSTINVPFKRGTRLATLSIEYASHEKLVKAGIISSSKEQPGQPNPFPADATTGCKPPPGWRG